jgi:hypothetical protein
LNVRNVRLCGGICRENFVAVFAPDAQRTADEYDPSQCRPAGARTDESWHRSHVPLRASFVNIFWPEERSYSAKERGVKWRTTADCALDARASPINGLRRPWIFLWRSGPFFTPQKNQKNAPNRRKSACGSGASGKFAGDPAAVGHRAALIGTQNRLKTVEKEELVAIDELGQPVDPRTLDSAGPRRCQRPKSWPGIRTSR